LLISISFYSVDYAVACLNLALVFVIIILFLIASGTRMVDDLFFVWEPLVLISRLEADFKSVSSRLISSSWLPYVFAHKSMLLLSACTCQQVGQ